MERRQGGVAYEFWLRVEKARVQQQLTKEDLHQRSEVARSTFDNLKTTTRPPQPRIVRALAEAVGMDQTEAARLAGLLPPEPAVSDTSVRAAIAASTVYTPAQKAALLAMIDALDEANGRRADESAQQERAV